MLLCGHPAHSPRTKPMSRCRVDKSIKRMEIDGVAFPLGVYPVEELKPRVGYTLAFEPADGPGESEEDSDWEEWPDRYVFDIMLSATRVESLCRSLFAMLPGRVYPILDVLGHDEYREVDPYVSYELVGQERFHDALRRYKGFFYEDGLVGFGAMSEEPFLYIFVDEHKIVTVRVQADMKERVERLLGAFDLTEIDEIAGADAATHEHRGVLDAPEDRLDLLNADEIVEELRNDWGLVLNIDPDRNIDEEGNDLGMTAWRCLARHETPPEDEPEQAGDAAGGKSPEGEVKGGSSASKGPAAAERVESASGEKASSEQPPATARKATKGKGTPAAPPDAGSRRATPENPASESDADDEAGPPLRAMPGMGRARYAEAIVTAESLAGAEKLLWEAMKTLTGKGPDDVDSDAVSVVVALDRIRPETFSEILAMVPKGKRKTPLKPDYSEAKVWHVRWLE